MGRPSWREKTCPVQVVRQWGDKKSIEKCRAKRTRIYGRRKGKMIPLGWLCPRCHTLELDDPITISGKHRQVEDQEIAFLIPGDPHETIEQED